MICQYLLKPAFSARHTRTRTVRSILLQDGVSRPSRTQVCHRKPHAISEHCGQPRPPQHGTFLYSSRRSFGIASRSQGRSASDGGSTSRGGGLATDSSCRALRLRGGGLASDGAALSRPGESRGRSNTGDTASARAPGLVGELSGVASTESVARRWADVGAADDASSCAAGRIGARRRTADDAVAPTEVTGRPRVHGAMLWNLSSPETEAPAPIGRLYLSATEERVALRRWFGYIIAVIEN